jgi:recombinational DNA repair protein (RecF pathway)
MRLGDDIDDHCSRCKRTTDHSVVSMTGDEVLVVRCRTCNSEHKYRHNKSRSKEMTAKEAFDKLVASMPGAQPETKEPEKKKKR